MIDQEVFANTILHVQGVDGFILVQKDGQILASKTDMSIKPQTLAAMMILSSRDCRVLQSEMGFSRFQYLMFSHAPGSTLYLFPVNDHLLGVIHRHPGHDPAFVKTVVQFIHRTFTKNPFPIFAGAHRRQAAQ